MSAEGVGGGDIIASFERAKKAAESWAKVYVSDPHTLLLDLDSEEALDAYARVLPTVQTVFGLSERERWESKGGNTHVVINSDASLPTVTRLLLQAALGSDGVREALGLWLFQNGVSEPSMLFRPRNR